MSSVVLSRHTRTTIFCGSSEDNSYFDYRFLLLFFNSRHITYIIVLETFIDVECAKALGRIILKLYEDQHGPNQYIQWSQDEQCNIGSYCTTTTNQPTNKAQESIFWGKNGRFWAKHPNCFGREQSFGYQCGIRCVYWEVSLLFRNIPPPEY